MLFKSEFNKYQTIITDRLVLKVLDESFVIPLLNFLENGRDSFEKYEAAKPPLYYTFPFQEHVLKSEYDASRQKAYLRYYVFEKEDLDKIIGTVSFGNILAEPYLSCNIGYKISPDKSHKGYCGEAVSAAVKAAYSYLDLHRINAFVQENNIASIRVLEKCGFALEGKCVKNIKVKGEWTDHLLYANIRSDGS